ncbi:LysM peptidoglycan-binding domain-containing protein [Paenibacillus sp. 5J-6]|uniref:LysM peptidoglycan-binding domain-containing protein n=1 Tax=Paenibacillus silvestris TaxID=2606219 RepID=A0A6L8VA38_9BACL|nr:LysM peptidoglycan-binding domain-containing protein [Paenibacillus silvestris]
MDSYTAQTGETLRSVAYRMRLDIQKLLSLNPHIPNPDTYIAGQTVNLVRMIHIPIAAPQPPETDLKQWIPLTSLEEMSQTEYDVLIVGAGAGGPAVLWRLCQQWGLNGKRIGIVERGDLLIPTHSMNIPTLNASRKRDFYKNISYPLGKSQPEYPGASQVFALGGKTLFWSTASPRMHPADFNEWPISYEELTPYYNIAERVMNISKGYTQDSTITTMMLEILRGSGFPEITELPTAIDLTATKFGQVHSNALFSSIAFLGSALNQRPFDLAVNARAVQILSENGNATGLRVMSPDKKSYVIKAKTIVVSASTWETPRLLLSSGIPGKAIGHYLMNHSKIVATVKIDRSYFPEVLGTLFIWKPRTLIEPYQMILYGPDLERYLWYPVFENKEVLKEFDIGIETLGVVEPQFENYIALNHASVDAYGVPDIQVRFSYSEKDKAIIGKMLQATNHMVASLLGTIGAKNRQPELSFYVPGEDYHEMGSYRMGNDPSTSATNPYGRIHGISNLYVADNSVIPYSGAANPTLTTVALAIRTTDHIIHQLSK